MEKRKTVRILFVNERCGYYGGVEQNIAETANGLRALGHHCLLAYGTGNHGRTQDGYHACFDATYGCRELGGPSDSSSVSSILADSVPDVVYLHKVPSFLSLAPHLKNTRTVRFYHDHDIVCPSTVKYFRFSGRTCCQKAGWRCWLDGGFLIRSNDARIGFKYDSIGRKLKELECARDIETNMVASQFMRNELEQNGFDGDSIHVLPYAVNLPLASPPPVPEAPKILFVGQLIRTKGVDLLLRALAKVNRDFSATIVGKGNGEGQLQKLCHDLGLADRVSFAGWVDRSKLELFYAEAKVAVVPSRWQEPFGIVGLEAMHFGRPVVAFAVGGIPDWLCHGETGLLVPEQDTEAFAQALTRLLDDTRLATEMGAVGQKRVADRFSFDRYLTRLEQILAGQVTVPGPGRLLPSQSKST